MPSLVLIVKVCYSLPAAAFLGPLRHMVTPDLFVARLL